MYICIELEPAHHTLKHIQNVLATMIAPFVKFGILPSTKQYLKRNHDDVYICKYFSKFVRNDDDDDDELPSQILYVKTFQNQFFLLLQKGSPPE